MDTNGALRKFFKKVHNVDIRTGDTSDIIEKAADLIEPGSGSTPMVVNISMNYDEETEDIVVNGDKTFAEITSAMNTNAVIGKINADGILFNTIGAFSGAIVESEGTVQCVSFMIHNFADGAVMVQYLCCDENNTWHMYVAFEQPPDT